MLNRNSGLSGLLAAVLSVAVMAPAMAQVDVAPFVKLDQFEQIKISPTGEFLAATVPMEDRTALVILKRADGKLAAKFSLGKNTVIYGFDWVNDTRVLVSMAEKFGGQDQPSATGELYGVDADGRQPQMLVGVRVEGSGNATRLGNQVQSVYAELIDDLPKNDREVLISVQSFNQDAYTHVERMDVYSGKRVPVAKSSVRQAEFVADHDGVVRASAGSGKDNESKLFIRSDDKAPWVLINDEAITNLRILPIGFSADNSVLYLQSDQPSGPDSVIALEIATGNRREVLKDALVDPAFTIISLGSASVPVGVGFDGPLPTSAFFDPNSAEARLQRMLEKSFPGQAVNITSTTKDGALALVSVYSASNPGDFYLFDVNAKKAELLMSRRSWFDPEQMAVVSPIEFKAADGLSLHGFLTTPHGSNGKNLPLVVMPHGGPYFVYDSWEFNDEAQLLAQAGYAVLQVNFRGSSNYGMQFDQAGARQTGLKMQDDLSDATRWAVKSGIADGARICIYGASYGGYAALMGAAKEPDLYKCAAGYVGIYDMDLRYSDLNKDRGSNGVFAKQWLGDSSKMAAISPTNMAARIKAPVFLAAGGEDEIAPIQHSKRMEAALKKAGVPVETLYIQSESHGFYTPEHQSQFYRQLLNFLAKNIGGKAAK